MLRIVNFVLDVSEGKESAYLYGQMHRSISLVVRSHIESRLMQVSDIY